MDDRKRTRDGKDACREYGVAKSVRIRKTNGAVEEAADELAALRPTTTTGRPFRETAVQPKSGGKSLNKFETIRHRSDGGGDCGTKFGRWSDQPLPPVREVRNENRKRYPNVKSRYAEPVNKNRKSTATKPAAQTTKDSLSDRKCVKVDRHISPVDLSGDPRSLQTAVLSPAERAYLNLIEEDGRFDRAAAAVGYVLLSDAPSRSRGPLDEAVDALKAEDGSPMALLRAALAFADQARNGRPRTAELFLLAASSLAADRGGSHNEVLAACLFATGRIYADVAAYGHDDRTRMASVRFLDWARRAASDHRTDWQLPADVRDATGARKEDGGTGGVWTDACFFQHKLLMETARDMEPAQALRAVQAAYRLLQLCGQGGRRRALVAYELGLKHAAVGSRSRAAKFFDECVAAAAGNADSDVDLEARLEAARMVPGPSSDGVLGRIVDQALQRRNGRLVARAIGARARLSADANRLNEAYHRFALAQRLTAWQTPDAAATGDDSADSDRLCAAMCRTYTFMQSNFQSLKLRGFDLLAEPRLWTGVRRPLVVWSRPSGQMYLNADRFRDGLVDAEARRLIRRIQSAADDEPAATSITAADSSQNDRLVQEKVLRFSNESGES